MFSSTWRPKRLLISKSFATRRGINTSSAALSATQNLEERCVDVIVTPAHLALLQNPAAHQRIQVLRGCQARDVQITLNEFDLGVGMTEKIVEQVLTVEFVVSANLS